MGTHLIIAENEKEFQAAENAIRHADALDEILLLSSAIHQPDNAPKNLKIVKPKDFLTRKDFENIEEKSSFFARNWYKSSAGFEESIIFQGISLGFLSENEMFVFLRDRMVQLKTIKKIMETKGISSITANRNALFGKAAVAVAKAKGFKKTNFFSLGREKGFSHLPNFSKKKIEEIKKKLPSALNEASKAENAKGKKIVFIRSRGYLGNLEEELRKDNSLSVVSLDNFLIKSIFNPAKMLDYLWARVSMRKKFRKAFEKLMKEKEFRKSLFFEGAELLQLLESEFCRFAERAWPEFAFLIKNLSMLFEKKKPDAVVLWVDVVPYERICAVLAKRTGAKGIVVQHGVFEPIMKKGSWIAGFAPMTGDIIAVWGPKFKRALIKKGIAPSRIFITGLPKFDAITKKKFDARETREKLGIKGNEKTLLFLPNLDTSKGTVEKIIAAIGEIPNSSLVIKPHPVDDAKKFAQAPEKTIIAWNMNTHELINAADAVIIQTSTAGLEAMLLGRPVIKFGYHTLNDIYNTGAVLKADDAASLKKVVALALGSKTKAAIAKKAKKFVLETAYKQDGKAIQRIIGIIKADN